MLTLTKASLALLLVTAAAVSSDADSLRHESRQLAGTYSSTSQYAYGMLALVNAQRAAQGLSPLCLNTKLMAAAMRHSNDMATNNFMSHTGSDGSSMASRISDAGFVWTRAGENVAAGQTTINSVMTAWMNSPGHRANILGDYTMFGTAYAYSGSSTYRHYWTQDFAKGSSERCSYEDAEYNETSTANATESAEVSFEDLKEGATALIPAVSATAGPEETVAP